MFVTRHNVKKFGFFFVLTHCNIMHRKTKKKKKSRFVAVDRAFDGVSPPKSATVVRSRRKNIRGLIYLCGRVRTPTSSPPSPALPPPSAFHSRTVSRLLSRGDFSYFFFIFFARSPETAKRDNRADIRVRFIDIRTPATRVECVFFRVVFTGRCVLRTS